MKIIGLMVVKNEDDIIGDCLDSAVKWADHIIIMNNGSTDKTEDIIIKKADQYPGKIIYWGRYDGYFRDGLRGLMYLDHKKLFNVGDWVIRLDADEFYIDDPREFLGRLPAKVNCVKNASFQYYYTDKDHEAEVNDPNFYEMSPASRLKYYLANWGELRCAKITEDMTWTLSAYLGDISAWPNFPRNYISSKRIRLKHFKYRSLVQIKKRLDVRLSTAKNTPFFQYEIQNLDIKDRIKNSLHLHYDDGVKDFIYSDEKLPPLIDHLDKKSEIVNI